MRLSFDKVMESVADALGEQVAPAVTDPFAAEAVRRAQLLVAIVGRAGVDAAAIRVEENARIRAILGQGAGVVGDDRFADAALSRDPGLRIGELDAETERLRTLLVELHTRLEELETPEARALDQEIWRALRDFEMARAPRA